MSLLKKLLYSFTAAGILSVTFLFITKTSPPVSKVLPMSRQTLTIPNVFARVGEYEISKLSGWTSPYAEVNLTGQGTNRKTTADGTGYFEFNSVLIKKSYGELCLTSQDVRQIPTLPLCLAPIPPSQNVEITGVLLPPSISLDRGKIISGENAKASGMTFPDSDVDVYLFENYNRYNFYKIYNFLFPTVNATGLPKYIVKSNEDGYFEFTLPTTNPSENRLFSTAIKTIPRDSALISAPFSAFSPKSNTLSFLVYKSNWLLLILLLLLLAIVIVFINKNKPKSIVPYQPVCLTNIPWGPKTLKGTI